MEGKTRLGVQEIEKLGFEFRDNQKQYGWYLVVSKNRVLTWCHSDEISLEFDQETYDYNNTLFDFKVKYVGEVVNIIDLFNPSKN